MQESTNIAARVGRWSAPHRKTAILGWLAFVVVTVGLMTSGIARRSRLSTAAEQIAGEAGEAEQALDDAGLRPTEELVLIQSETLTADDPAFRRVIDETAATLCGPSTSRTSRSPLDGTAAAISEDGHSAFVEFEVTGDEEDIDDNLEPSGDAVAAPRRRASRVHRRAVRRRKRQQGDQRHASTRTSARPGCSRCRSRC